MIKLSEKTFYDPKAGFLYEKILDDVSVRSGAGFIEVHGNEAETLWNWLNESWQYEAMKGG